MALYKDCWVVFRGAHGSGQRIWSCAWEPQSQPRKDFRDARTNEPYNRSWCEGLSAMGREVDRMIGALRERWSGNWWVRDRRRRPLASLDLRRHDPGACVAFGGRLNWKAKGKWLALCGRRLREVQGRYAIVCMVVCPCAVH